MASGPTVETRIAQRVLLGNPLGKHPIEERRDETIILKDFWDMGYQTER